MFQFKSIDQSPILNFCKKKKRSITALSLASLSAATLAITTGIAPVKIAGVSNQEPAMAWQSWEKVYYQANFSGWSQASADSYCSNTAYTNSSVWLNNWRYISDVNGNLWGVWRINHVWAHRSLGVCVLNLTY
jgi:hypothetical protein